jgi:hypothetical protein
MAGADAPYLRKWRKRNPGKAAAYCLAWRKRNPRKVVTYSRAYKVKHRAESVVLINAWRIRNPLKHAAHRSVAAALRNGKLIKQPCQICGSLIVQAHHEDYAKPLKVVWLCKPHHVKADARKRMEVK